MLSIQPEQRYLLACSDLRRRWRPLAAESGRAVNNAHATRIAPPILLALFFWRFAGSLWEPATRGSTTQPELRCWIASAHS